MFIAIPLLEIALLIKIGQAIGFWATIAMVIGSAVLGTWLLHKQGMETLRRVLTAMDDGKPPVEPVLQGFLLLSAGLLLLTPGILTDALGLILLIPPVRELIVRYGLKRLFVVTVSGRSRRSGPAADATRPDVFSEAEDTGPRGPAGPETREPRQRSPLGGGPVIEGEFERLEERTIDPRRTKK
ncbi:MAG: FxsA family protein [Hyphomicrobiaceae bacterium]|nr:FxsA family protein [Hyphomicrobiaceae bacterium]MCC0007403.1 FxsA family protein [Hyphomicrobiaceae bacterium]